MNLFFIYETSLDAKERHWIWKLETLTPQGLNVADTFHSQNSSNSSSSKSSSRKKRSRSRYKNTNIVKVTLTSARCDTVFHIRR